MDAEQVSRRFNREPVRKYADETPRYKKSFAEKLAEASNDHEDTGVNHV